MRKKFLIGFLCSTLLLLCVAAVVQQRNGIFILNATDEVQFKVRSQVEQTAPWLELVDRDTLKFSIPASGILPVEYGGTGTSTGGGSNVSWTNITEYVINPVDGSGLVAGRLGSGKLVQSLVGGPVYGYSPSAFLIYTNAYLQRDLYVTNGVIHAKSSASNSVVMLARGGVTQNTNLFEAQNSSAVPLAVIDKDGIFTGSGAGLTNIGGGSNTFVGSFTGSGAGLTNIGGGSNTFVGAFTGDGAGLTNIGGGSNTFVGSFTGDGAGLTNIGGGSNTFVGSFTGSGAGLTNIGGGSNTFVGSFTGSGAGLTNIGGGSNTFVGSFTGNGAGLTNLPATAQTPWNQDVNGNQFSLTNVYGVTVRGQGVSLLDPAGNHLVNIAGGSTNLTTDAQSVQSNGADSRLLYHSVPGHTWGAWSWTASNTFAMSYVSLRINRAASSPGTVTLRIYAAGTGALPTGPVLASSAPFNLTSLSTFSPYYDIPFNFPTPLSMTSGTKYAYVLEPSGTSGNIIGIKANSGLLSAALGVAWYNSDDGVTWDGGETNVAPFFTVYGTNTTRVPGQISLFADANQILPVTNIFWGSASSNNAIDAVLPGSPPTRTWYNGTGGPVNVTVTGTLTGDGSGLTNLGATALLLTNNTGLPGLVVGNGIGTNATTFALKTDATNAVNGILANSNSYNGSFTGNGAGLTNMPLTGLTIAPLTNQETRSLSFSNNVTIDGDLELNGASSDATIDGNLTVAGGGSNTLGLNVGSGTLVVTNGSVLIGTATPNAKLAVAGDLSTAGHIGITGSYALLSLPNSNARVYVRESGNGVEMYSGGSSRMVIDSSGNVGIGTTAPDSRLSVSNLTSASLLKVSGAASASIFNVTSNGNATLSGTLTATGGVFGAYASLDMSTNGYALPVNNATNQYVGFDTQKSFGTGIGFITNSIWVTNAGEYRIQFDDSFRCAAGTGVMYLLGRTNGVDHPRLRTQRTATTSYGSASKHAYLTLPANTILSFWVGTSENETFTFESAVFSVAPAN